MTFSYTRYFFCAVAIISASVILMLSSCSPSNKPSSENNAGNNDSAALPDTIDEAANAPVFKGDAKNHELSEPITKREVLSFYKALPDKFFPVSGKPESAIKVVNKATQYMHLEYNEELSADVKLFRDTDTGRDYFAVFRYERKGNKAPRATYSIFYMKSKHAIESTRELMPRVTPSTITSLYAEKNIRPDKEGVFFKLSPTSDDIQLVTASNSFVLMTIPWRYGRFNY